MREYSTACHRGMGSDKSHAWSSRDNQVEARNRLCYWASACQSQFAKRCVVQRLGAGRTA